MLRLLVPFLSLSSALQLAAPVRRAPTVAMKWVDEQYEQSLPKKDATFNMPASPSEAVKVDVSAAAEGVASLIEEDAPLKAQPLANAEGVLVSGIAAMGKAKNALDAAVEWEKENAVVENTRGAIDQAAKFEKENELMLTAQAMFALAFEGVFEWGAFLAGEMQKSAALRPPVDEAAVIAQAPPAEKKPQWAAFLAGEMHKSASLRAPVDKKDAKKARPKSSFL
eukprot:7095165-Prymnesium_polylepis.1